MSLNTNANNAEQPGLAAEAPPELTEDVGAQTEENAEAWADAGGPIDPPEGEAEGGDDAPAGEKPAGEGEEQPAADEYAEPPEFWGAERKGLWNKDLPLELRQAIHEHERESAKAINGKLMEAAEKTKNAEGNAQRLLAERDQAANWWQQTGPRLNQAFANKWDGIDWVKMANEDAGLYARAKAQHDEERRVLDQTHQRMQTEIQGRNERAQQAFRENKASEHAKLATKLPEHFGDNTKAQATYDRLGKFLGERGFTPERIQAIYEAPVIEIALESMLYREAQAKAKAALAKPNPNTATQTSRRIVPAARPAGQANGNEATRQAEQRLKSGQDLSDSDVERLFG